MILPLSYVFADLSVSGVFVRDGFYKVSFNGSFSVSDITLKTAGSETEIVFPSYKDKNQVAVLKREHKKRFAKDIKENKVSGPVPATAVKFKINKFSPVKNLKQTLAFASVIFEDVLEVECRILSGRNGLWVAWPAANKNGVWKKQFEFIDKSLKREVEGKLLERYENEKSKGK